MGRPEVRGICRGGIFFPNYMYMYLWALLTPTSLFSRNQIYTYARHLPHDIARAAIGRPKLVCPSTARNVYK